jgi:hypothetical protein
MYRVNKLIVFSRIAWKDGNPDPGDGIPSDPDPEPD